ncbi:MAG: UvrD-helicase domain-containing protein [Thermodesulfobacteriota bacterium]
MAEAPDNRERKEALEPQRSFIMQAPAGSGKTTLLIQRFLRLLATVKKPEEILAITFTRKAAGEMQGRVFASLQKAASGEKAEDECGAVTLDLACKALIADKKHGWNLLENPGRLRVLTIDAFCASLTRQTPLLSRLGMEPVVTERPRPLYEEAVRRVLAMMDDDEMLCPHVMQLLRYNDNMASDLQTKLVVMLAKRDQWLRHIPGETAMEEDGLREGLEEALLRLVEEGLAEAARAFPSELSALLTASARYAAGNVEAGHPAAVLRDLDSMPGASADSLGLWKAVAYLLLTAAGEWRSPRGVNKNLGFPSLKTDEAVEARDFFKGLLTALEGNDELLHALQEVRRLPGPRYDEEDWRTLGALARVLPVAVWHLWSVFAEAGVLDFPAVSLAALQALGQEDNPTDLMLHLDNTFRHILVDEYQDTSWTQVSLIRALTNGWEPGDGRTLFLVGDPMQSIYRFRDADVGLFLRARQGSLGMVSLDYIRLRSNFRSEGHIVNWVNETFGLIFPHVPDVTTGAVPYSEALAVKGLGESARVNVRLYRGRDDEAEAGDVIELIRGIKSRAEKDESVAVLGRSRPHLEAIVTKLTEAGIDFLAKDLENLGERPVILGLLALVRALLDPADRVAWLSVLREGWCGLTLKDLHVLCMGNGDAPLWELINDESRVRGLGNEGARRLLAFRNIMKKALKLRGRQAWRPLLEGLWTALGGQALYEDEAPLQEAERFFEIVESLEKENPDFTADEVESRVSGLYAAGSAATDNPVHVMTVHGAKGLEFDHVILPGMGRRPRNTDKEILYWMERESDLLLAPMEKKGAATESLVYKYLKAVERERETLEGTRLLYVAATRAAKELYLFGHIEAASEEIKADKRSFLGLISHVLSRDMVREAENKPVKEPAAPPQKSLKRLSPLWKAPAPAPSCELPGELAEAGEAPGAARPVFDWAGAGARHSGTVAHRYFQRIVNEGLSKWDAERVLGEKACMEAMLRGLGLNRETAREGAKRSVRIIRGALVDTRGQWILGEHEEGAVEYALTGVVDGQVRRVVIDRTFVDDKGVRWVIDYKTGQHSGGDLEVFLNSEKERYGEQLEEYAALLGNLHEEGEIRKGLYYPAIPAWIEW